MIGYYPSIVFSVLLAYVKHQIPPNFEKITDNNAHNMIEAILNIEQYYLHRMFHSNGGYKIEFKVDDFVFENTKKHFENSDTKWLDNLGKSIFAIDKLYKDLLQHMDTENPDESRIKHFLLPLIDGNSSILHENIINIRNAIEYHEKPGCDNIFCSVNSKPDDSICTGALSSQAQMYEVWKTIVITEIHAQILNYLANGIQDYNHTYEVDFTNSKFSIIENELDNYKIYLIKNFPQLSNQILSCTPSEMKQETYIQVTPSMMQLSSNFIEWISLQEQSSELHKNMVVTGIRFIVNNVKMIDIQIKQGKLGPAGNIVRDTEHWLPLIEINKKEKNPTLHKADDYLFYVVRTSMRFPLRENRHYALIMDGQSSMLFDDITVPKGHVVTGARIKAIREDVQEKYLQYSLEVKATPFDFATGNLIKARKSSMWINYKMLNPKPKIYNQPRTLNKPDYPISPLQHLNGEYKIDMKENSKFIFRYPFMVQDHLIPFFDAVAVETKPSTPLGGIGLNHKRISTDTGGPYGGFSTFKIHTLDASQYA